jgi:hypothetical protein
VAPDGRPCLLIEGAGFTSVAIADRVPLQCRISFAAGTSFGYPVILVEGGTVTAYNINYDGSGFVDVLPGSPGPLINVFVTSAIPSPSASTAVAGPASAAGAAVRAPIVSGGR